MLVGLDINVTSRTTIQINLKEQTEREGRGSTGHMKTKCFTVDQRLTLINVRNAFQLDLWAGLSDRKKSEALQLFFNSDTIN